MNGVSSGLCLVAERRWVFISFAGNTGAGSFAGLYDLIQVMTRAAGGS